MWYTAIQPLRILTVGAIVNTRLVATLRRAEGAPVRPLSKEKNVIINGWLLCRVARPVKVNIMYANAHIRARVKRAFRWRARARFMALSACELWLVGRENYLWVGQSKGKTVCGMDSRVHTS